MSNNNTWDVADEVHWCEESQTLDSECLCQIRVIYGIHRRDIYFPISDRLESQWRITTKSTILRCHHQWRGFTECSRYSVSKCHDHCCMTDACFLQPDVSHCRFCNAKVPLTGHKFHYDDEDLCGLRKTTLLGTVITSIYRALRSKKCVYEPDSLLDYGDVGIKALMGQFPYLKTVEFEDEKELREKYKYLSSSSIIRRKELNPTKRIKEEEEIIIGFTNDPYQPHTPIFLNQQQQQE
jgi:hypothetical protein